MKENIEDKGSDESIRPKSKPPSVEEPTGKGLDATVYSEIFSATTPPNDGEQVVCIRSDGWWGKGAWYARFGGWMVNGTQQQIAFWMRVFVPNAETHLESDGADGCGFGRLVTDISEFNAALDSSKAVTHGGIGSSF